MSLVLFLGFLAGDFRETWSSQSSLIISFFSPQHTIEGRSVFVPLVLKLRCGHTVKYRRGSLEKSGRVENNTSDTHNDRGHVHTWCPSTSVWAPAQNVAVFRHWIVYPRYNNHFSA